MDPRSWTVAKDMQRERLAWAEQERLAHLAMKEEDLPVSSRIRPPTAKARGSTLLSVLRSVAALPLTLFAGPRHTPSH